MIEGPYNRRQDVYSGLKHRGNVFQLAIDKFPQ